MTKAHTPTTTGESPHDESSHCANNGKRRIPVGWLLRVSTGSYGQYICRSQEVTDQQLAVSRQFSQILAVTPAYRYAPEVPNLYNFAYDGSLERSLVPGGEMFQSGQISFSSHLPWRSAEMGSPFGGIMAYER